MEIYSHTLRPQMRDVADVVDDILKGKSGENGSTRQE
jgi:hypothetical protein